MSTNTSTITAEQAGFNAFLCKAFTILAGAIGLCAVAYLTTAANPSLMAFASSGVGQTGMFIGLIAIIFMCNHHTKPNKAWFCLITFAALSGIQLAPYLITKGNSEIAMNLFTATLMFAVSAGYGYITKRDLIKWSSAITIALISIIVVSITNWYIGSGLIDSLISLIIIPLGMFIVASSLQTYRELYNRQEADSEESLAINAALSFFIYFKLLFVASD